MFMRALPKLHFCLKAKCFGDHEVFRYNIVNWSCLSLYHLSYREIFIITNSIFSRSSRRPVVHRCNWKFSLSSVWSVSSSEKKEIKNLKIKSPFYFRSDKFWMLPSLYTPEKCHLQLTPSESHYYNKISLPLTFCLSPSLSFPIIPLCVALSDLEISL